MFNKQLSKKGVFLAKDLVFEGLGYDGRWEHYRMWQLVSDIGILLFNLLFKRSYYCQNPNLITTQPQLNLNLVGFDMIITLHTHHHHHPQELYFYQKWWS